MLSADLTGESLFLGWPPDALPYLSFPPPRVPHLLPNLASDALHALHFSHHLLSNLASNALPLSLSLRRASLILGWPSMLCTLAS